MFLWHILHPYFYIRKVFHYFNKNETHIEKNQTLTNNAEYFKITSNSVTQKYYYHYVKCTYFQMSFCVYTYKYREREKGSESGRKRDVSLETDFFPLKCLWDPAGMFSLLCSCHSLIFFLLLLIRDANFPLENHSSTHSPFLVY